MVLNYIISIIWLFLPASFANMAPVFVKNIPFLAFPLDHKKKLGKKRILGDHKTYRGLFFGIIFAQITVQIQALLYSYSSYVQSISFLDYSTTNILLLGLLQGCGTLGGDAIKSFIKRRRNIKPGVSWIPFDQIDWILGTSILLLIYVNIPWQIIVVAIIVLGLLHPVINYMGYLLHVKKNKI